MVKIKKTEKFEKQLEDLKSSTDDGDIIKGKILELENLIKKYYTQKAEAAKIRSRIKWAEEGERSTRYFFELEKKQGDNKMLSVRQLLNLYHIYTYLLCF